MSSKEEDPMAYLQRVHAMMPHVYWAVPTIVSMLITFMLAVDIHDILCLEVLMMDLVGADTVAGLCDGASGCGHCCGSGGGAWLARVLVRVLYLQIQRAHTHPPQAIHPLLVYDIVEFYWRQRVVTSLITGLLGFLLSTSS